MSSMSGSSRGRSLVRRVSGKRGRSRSTRSGSTARYSTLSNRGDGPTIRGYPYGSSYSMFFDPFPRTMRAILRYSEVFNFNTSAATPQKQFMRAGSINDPNYSGVGYQPYGHDQYQGLYNHYRVIKSVCKITNTSNGASNIMGLALHDDVSATNDFDAIRTMKPVKFVPLCGTTEPRSLEMTYNSAQVFPGQKQATTALFGNNPAEEQYFMIWVTGGNPLSDPGAISIVVAIDYYVEFSELKQLVKS